MQQRVMVGPVGQTHAQVTLGPGWGWSEHRFGEVVVHVKGHLLDGPRTLEGRSAAQHIANTLGAQRDAGAVEKSIPSLAGQFAFVMISPARIVASVDRIRTIPLFFAVHRGGVLIDDRAMRLRDVLDLGAGDIDPAQALAAAMTGYTIGDHTLYRRIETLGAGQALVVEAGAARRLAWFTYDAWRTEDTAKPEKRLSELNRFIIERLRDGAAGRTICVPLSAGYDSRFIAAGLKAAGARNVRMFSYGRPGNHEIETAKLIAERLGYPWRMVPFTTATQRAMFADPVHEEALWHTADSCTAVPFEQDWRAIEVLRRDGYIPADAIVVNGQTGDFISGNHAPVALMDCASGESAEAREQRVTQSFLAKHARLWTSLATPENDAALKELLSSEAWSRGATFGSDENLAGIHEMLEYENRQAKYVVSGQRTYEAQGLAWRLPLWDDEYIQFWRRAPADLKRGQALYRSTLERDNWAGVFQGIPVNRKTITPHWIRPIRALAKVACAPLGARRWHAAERRLLGWSMDPLRVTAVVPYRRALLDRRGARHGVSWLTERWLAKHGITVPGPAARDKP